MSCYHIGGLFESCFLLRMKEVVVDEDQSGGQQI